MCRPDIQNENSNQEQLSLSEQMQQLPLLPHLAATTFLKGMSHELRTPLNAILGFAQMLRRESSGPLTGRQAEFVEQIESGGNHLKDLIDGILGFARLEAGQLTIKTEPVPIWDILADARLLVAAQAEGRGIRVAWADEYEIPLMVDVDALRARQILVNLLTNAIKYNRPFGKVTVDVTESRSTVKVAVSDEGFGIPYDRQPDVFQAFNRLGMEASEIEGSGIGLAYSRKLAEAMKSHLGFESTPGVGSCFWVEFPRVTDMSANEGRIRKIVAGSHLAVAPETRH